MIMKQIQTKPTRLWFLARGYKQADPRDTNGQIVWLHPHTNDVLSQYGTKLSLQVVPKEKHHAKAAQYLRIPKEYGSILLARLKYLTFVGPIKEGEVIDHIDGNTFNNNIRNLRAVPRSINDRDGGFMRKLRNNGIYIHMYCANFILEGFARMAEWQAAHSRYAYDNLRGQELEQVFFGPTFTVCDPDILMDLDFTRHPEI